MALAKEPEGVDFIIKSKPLSKEAQLALSKYIRKYKEKHADKKIAKRKPQRKEVSMKRVKA